MQAAFYTLRPQKPKFTQPTNRHNPHHNWHFLGAFAAQFDDCVADKTQRDAVCNGIGKRHKHNRHKGWRSFGDIAPINFGGRAHHLYANVQQGWRSCKGWHGFGKWRKPQTRQQQQAHQ